MASTINKYFGTTDIEWSSTCIDCSTPILVQALHLKAVVSEPAAVIIFQLLITWFNIYIIHVGNNLRLSYCCYWLINVLLNYCFNGVKKCVS